MTSIEENSRTYPCPECVETAPLERVSIVQHHTLVDARINDPAYIDIAKQAAGHRLVSGLLDAGFVNFMRGPEDIRDFTFSVQATIGVVSPKHVAHLQNRIAEHQDQLALEAMAEAQREINNWGSYYNHQSLRKEDANRFIREALTAVLAKRAAWKAA